MSRTLTDVHRFKEGVSHALTTYPVELLIPPGSEQHENYRTPSIPLKHRALTSNAKEPHPWRSQPHPEEWLLIEWPRAEAEPTKYWLSTLPANTKLRDPVRLAKQRWIIERDYQELKQELGLGHYEGRGWRGFHLPSTFREWRMGHTKASGDTTQPSISNIGTPPGIASQRPRGLRASGFTTCAIPSSRTWWSAACH